jgi:hypothetical protein
MEYLKGYEPVLEQWWPSVSKQVRTAMDKHLKSIKDPSVRAHVERNFKKRADQLDEMGQNGLSNYGSDWYRTTFPILRYGTLDHQD